MTNTSIHFSRPLAGEITTKLQQIQWDAYGADEQYDPSDPLVISPIDIKVCFDLLMLNGSGQISR